MTNNLISRGIILVAALAFTACPTGKKCTTSADCGGGQTCSVMSGTCTTATGGGSGGGGGAGGGGGSGGGSVGGGGGGGGAGAGDGGTTVNNGAETCAMAMLITPGTISGSTVGLMNDYNPGCTGDVTPGPDTVYKISVPAGQRLTATATPALATMGNQYDLALYLIQAPASNCTNADGGMGLTCLGASDSPTPAESPESAGFFNGGTSAVDVFIVIDSYYDAMHANPDGGVGRSNEGSFTLVTSLGAPTTGDRCETAIALSTTTPLLNQNLANFGNDYTGTMGSSCNVGSAAADATYKVTVPAGQVLSVTVTPSVNFDATLSASESAAACGVTCLATVDIGGNGVADTLVYKNTSNAAQTLFIVVDGYQGSTGTFGLEATLTTPAADDTCSGPTALTSGTALTAQALASYTKDYSGGTGCLFSDGADRVYSVQVPAGQRVSVTAAPATADLTLNLVGGGAANCGTTCLASQDNGVDGEPETLAFTNSSGMAQTYLVIVGMYAGGAGTFSIVATVATPPADDVCAGPTALPVGTLSGQTTLGYTNDYENGVGTVGCSSSTGGNDRVYQVSIPANQRGVVTVTPTADAGYDPSLNLVEGAAAVCAAMPRVCVTGADRGFSDAPETVSLYNTTAAARTFFAIVDSAAGGGVFDLAFSSAVPGADDTCTTNTTTLGAATRTDNLTNFTADYNSGAGCKSSTGPDRVYKVPLTANQKLTFTATPTLDAGFDPVINFIAGPAANCEALPRTCRFGVNVSGAGQPETGGYTNNTGATQDVYMVVADYGTSATNRDFSLVTTLAAATAGESCQVPLVTAAGMLTAQTTIGASPDVIFASTATGCVSTGARADRVYSVTVPNNQTLTVVATPGATEDILINIIDGAAATCNNVMMCAAKADTGGAGVAETATFMNASGAAKTVFVMVAGYFGPTSYSLNVQIQ